MLRAAGVEILSTPQGYRLPQSRPAAHRTTLACRHTPEQRPRRRLNILVDHGVRILDVVVEHQALRRAARVADDRVARRRTGFSSPLAKDQSQLALDASARSVHLHTVEANRPEMIARAKARLHEQGILLK